MRKLLLIPILLVIYTSLFSQVDYDQPQAYEIASIEVQGAQYSDPESIKLLSGLQKGMQINIPGPEIAEAIKKLWEQRIFSDVEVIVDRIIADQVYLIIKVTERERIASFEFSGVTKSQADDLREKINFIRATIWTSEKETRAKRIIRNFFVEKGYLNTEVEIKTVPDPYMQNGLIVQIDVDRGSRVKINDIAITGAGEFSQNKLKRQMKRFLKEKKFYRFWSRSKFIPNNFEKAQDALIAFYNSEGYRDAKIIADTFYMHDKNSVDVRLDLYEGKKYYIRNIDWVGNYKYTTNELNAVLGLHPGDVYNSEELQRRLFGDLTRKDISSMYLDDGYLFFNVNPVEVAVVGDSIDLELRVSEGPQATIRKVSVQGNTRTSDYVILRELRTLPGQKFSRANLIRSQREILALGYFDQEKMNVIPIPDPENGTVDLKYIVEEKPSDQLQLQGGWGGRPRDNQNGFYTGGFVGTVAVNLNNFSTKRMFQKGGWFLTGGSSPLPAGDGQRLSLAAQFNGSGFQNYSISFLEPWLGGKKPNSLGVSANYSVQNVPSINYRLSILGASVDYGQRMRWPDDFFRSYTGVSYKYYELENVPTSFGTFNDEVGFINVISLRQTFERNSINAPLYPTAGSVLSFSVEATPPYSLFQDRDWENLSDSKKFKFLEYHKWKFQTKWFYSLDRRGKLVLNPKAELGFLGFYNPDVGLSPFERFFLGGDGLSGYNLDGRDIIALRGYPQGINPVGGAAVYSKYTLELKYPLTMNQTAPIWVLAFLEAGNSWDGLKSMNPFDLKRSAGVGIRVVLPMVGILGVDYGIPFNEVAPGVQGNGRFSFVIGQAF